MKRCLWLSIVVIMRTWGECVYKIRTVRWNNRSVINSNRELRTESQGIQNNAYPKYVFVSYDQKMKYKKRKKKETKYSNAFLSNLNIIKIMNGINRMNRKEKKHLFRIFRGCGVTESYEWVEQDDHLEIKIRLSETVHTEDIQYCLKSDYIYVKLKDRTDCLMKGRLKGSVDTVLSTWFIEKYDGYNVLNIYLKKRKKGIDEWVGVVEKECVLHLSYDESPTALKENTSSSFFKNVKENELLYSHTFENVKFDDAYEFLLNWTSKKSTTENDFGMPITKLKTSVMQNEYGMEIFISGFDLNWKAEDSLVMKLSSVKNGIMLHVFRGKVASGILGKHGNGIRLLVKECEDRILKKLQHDIKGVFYLNPMFKKLEKAMHTQNPAVHYRVAEEGKGESIEGDNCVHKTRSEEMGSDNMREMEQQIQMRGNKTMTEKGKETEKDTEKESEEKEGKEKMPKEVTKDSPEENLVVKELNLESKIKLTCDDKSKEPEFMKNWSEEKKIEFRRNSVLQLKRNLELSQEKKVNLKLEDYVNHMKAIFDLSDEESQLMWKKGCKKTEEQKERQKFHEFIEIEQLTDRIQSYESYGLREKDEKWKPKEYTEISHGARTVYQVSPTIPKKNMNIQFLHILDNDLSYPVDEKKQSLYEIYRNSSEEAKKEMRNRWRISEMRLNTLIEELKYIGQDDSIVATICNNYRDVLLSEEYTCLMNLRLFENPPQTIEDKKVLQKINFFVMSLYDDVKILMEHEEKEHLKKIRLICMKAIEDEKGLNEYIESMKPILDYSFLAYIKHAIETEKKNILSQKKDFREEPSDWLIILLIIKKGIYSVLEKDIWEDVIHISTIVCHEQPSVRKTLLQTIVAAMSKADWIFFKDLINTLYTSVLEKKLTVNHFPNFPHIIEAIFQLHFDIEQILPDWFIKEMLDDYDKSVIEQMKERKPIFWKMKETQWDKKFVSDFRKKQIEKFQEYISRNSVSSKKSHDGQVDNPLNR